MLDQHVNRWHVEARQRVKLSHTNRSSGLKHRLPRAAANPLPWRDRQDSRRTGYTETKSNSSSERHILVRLIDLVVIAGVNTPDPIPNSAVKSPSANGTAS